MATSGSFSGSAYSGHYKLICEWSASQDVSANQSYITVNHYFWHDYSVSYSTSKSGTTNIDGNTSSWSYTKGDSDSSGKHLLYTATHTISHNSDGTRSFSISATYNVNITVNGTSISSITANSGTIYLDTIPRASSVSSGIGFTAGIDNAMYISVNSSSGSFTHQALFWLQQPDGTWQYVGETDINSKFSTSTTMYFNSTHVQRMYTYLQGWEYRPFKIELRTYNGSTQIGSSESVGTVYGATPATISFNNFYIGDYIDAYVNNMYSGFTYTGTFTFGSFSKSLSFDPSSPNVRITFTQAEIDSMFAQIPNSNYGVGNVYVSSKYNGVEINDGHPVDQNKGFTAYVGGGSAPSFGTGYTYRDTNQATINITGNNQYIIQNNSTLLFELPTSANATAKNSATMKSYVVTINGVSSQTLTYSSTATISYNFGAINAGNNLTLTVRAYDSRGLWAETSKTITIIPYDYPTVNTTVTRKNNFESTTTITLGGQVSQLNVGGTNKNSIVSATYKWKETTTSIYGNSSNFTITGMPSYTATSVNINGTTGLDIYKSYDVQISVTDKIGTTTVTKTVPVGQPIMFLDAIKKSVGINQFPTHSNALDITGDVYVTGGRINTPIVSSPSIRGTYIDDYMLQDHANGNVTVNALGGQLYLGYRNTTMVKLSSDLYDASGQKQLLTSGGTFRNITTDTDLTVNSSSIWARGGWIRVTGNQGIYFQDWGGGWNMEDSYWMRCYGDKAIYTGGIIKSGSGFQNVGKTPAFTWSGSLNMVNGNSAYYDIPHNLGYYPIVTIAGNIGNIILTYSYINVNTVRVCNWNSGGGGGNGWSGVVYLW